MFTHVYTLSFESTIDIYRQLILQSIDFCTINIYKATFYDVVIFSCRRCRPPSPPPHTLALPSHRPRPRPRPGPGHRPSDCWVTITISIIILLMMLLLLLMMMMIFVFVIVSDTVIHYSTFSIIFSLANMRYGCLKVFFKGFFLAFDIQAAQQW